MATITASLIERTPHRLRYKLVSDGVAGPTTWFIGSSVVGPSPDLIFDAHFDPTAPLPSPISTLVSVGGVPNDAAAQKRLNGVGLITNPDPANTMRGHLSIMPLNSTPGPGQWSVDAALGTPFGFPGVPIIVGDSPFFAGFPSAAIVTLEVDTLYNY